jgi:hypothetical protein
MYGVCCLAHRDRHPQLFPAKDDLDYNIYYPPKKCRVAYELQLLESAPGSLLRVLRLSVVSGHDNTQNWAYGLIKCSPSSCCSLQHFWP